ncbi:HEAT repeat domain-containing protein [Leptolyngbyaceae cyanobacterium CCMR0082]|uniref:HEAT repeat domain-containing protein n=1 Tax=Adonisia turfae CCMR0082 TaxID=2304604 RepID=A0A6M0S6J8_9CYAN|nr:STM4015 family protein [Adonisia turfae]NEZ63990.1 HEAT repeat domain-containing protein [Adonisia turfae CCMR0082]
MTDSPTFNGAQHTVPGWNLTERLAGYGGYEGKHTTRFANRTVQEFQHDQSLANPQNTAYALRCDYDDDESLVEVLQQLVNRPEATDIEALVLGLWQGDGDVCTEESSTAKLVSTLAEINDRLPNLKALFIGDITYEECEISWLQQSDMSPLLLAYPQLEILQVRGGTGLTFTTPAKHDYLKALILETGGLSRDTVYQIYNWKLPALEHLEFWFGSDNYGGDCWEQDLEPVLDNLCFSNLAYLGLRNSKFTNELIERLVKSALLPRLRVLDLSLGTLSDAGATELLASPAIRDLEILNVSESYLSDALIEQLTTLGMQIIADGQRQEEEDEDPEFRRYCVVSE